MILKRIADRALLPREMVEQCIQLVDNHLSLYPYFNMAISGGRSPEDFFRQLSKTAVTYKKWNRVNVFWVDERWVHHENEESNYGSALRCGLRDLPMNFFPFNTQINNIQDSLSEYRNVLTEHGIDKEGFDLVILGAGVDGHTASIFVEDIARMLSDLCYSTRHPQTGQWRLSLTPQSIIHSKNIWLLLTGENKRNILNSLNQTDTKTPIQIIVSASKEVTIFTDIHY